MGKPRTEEQRARDREKQRRYQNRLSEEGKAQQRQRQCEQKRRRRVGEEAPPESPEQIADRREGQRQRRKAYMREYLRRYRLEHGEELKTKKREHYIANREAILAKQRAAETPQRKRARADRYKTWASRNGPRLSAYKLRWHDAKRFGGLRGAVVARDRETCALCGSRVRLVVHHKDQDTQNNVADNLVTVCRGCHARVHAELSRDRDGYGRFV